MKLFSKVLVIAVMATIGAITFGSSTTAHAAGGPPTNVTRTIFVHGVNGNSVFGIIDVTDRGTVDINGHPQRQFELVPQLIFASKFKFGELGLTSSSNGDCPCADFGATSFSMRGHVYVNVLRAKPIDVIVNWDSTLGEPCGLRIINANNQTVALGQLC